VGLRDRAILETFYSTGIRRLELIHLEVFDLDMHRGTLLIRLGKGQRDRMVPIGHRAVGWIDRYLQDSRPKLVVDPNERALFTSKLGMPLTPDALTKLVSVYVEQAGIGSTGSCHMLRHTMATLMLEGGADVRIIQAILGHVSLSTTEVYTHVSIRQLQEVHRKTHPASRPRPGKQGSEPGTEAARDALLTALSSEGAEESFAEEP